MATLKGKQAAHCTVHRPSAVSFAETAKAIDKLFGVWTRVGPRKHVLDGSAHWRHLANMSVPSMCGDVAAFLSNYFYF